MQPILYRSMAALMKEYKRNEETILKAFQNALEELYLTAGKMQSSGEKGTLSYLGICYCLSSAYTGNYGLRLDLYDKEFYLDETVCCVYWNPNFFVSHLEEDIACFRHVIKQKIPRVKAYEEQQFIVGYVRNYMYIVLEFLRQKMPNVLKKVKKDDLQVSEEFRIFFGEYMGKCTIINLYSA